MKSKRASPAQVSELVANMKLLGVLAVTPAAREPEMLGRGSHLRAAWDCGELLGTARASPPSKQGAANHATHCNAICCQSRDEGTSPAVQPASAKRKSASPEKDEEDEGEDEDELLLPLAERLEKRVEKETAEEQQGGGHSSEEEDMLPLAERLEKRALCMAVTSAIRESERPLMSADGSADEMMLVSEVNTVNDPRLAEMARSLIDWGEELD
jgi:hypothetical protein